MIKHLSIEEFIITKRKSFQVNEEIQTNDERPDLLREENERLKNERMCVVCLSKEKNILLLPCAHLTSCLECSFNLQNCPLCRSIIQATVKTYS